MSQPRELPSVEGIRLSHSVNIERVCQSLIHRVPLNSTLLSLIPELLQRQLTPEASPIRCSRVYLLVVEPITALRHRLCRPKIVRGHVAPNSLFRLLTVSPYLFSIILYLEIPVASPSPSQRHHQRLPRTHPQYLLQPNRQRWYIPRHRPPSLRCPPQPS
jgi:hypothetical protein